MVSHSSFFNRYQEVVKKTDRTPQKGLAGLHFLLLGLFGEVGSLLSELKKKQRDADSYTGYEEAVYEEFGDVMWYFANISNRIGLDIASCVKLIESPLTDDKKLVANGNVIYSFKSLGEHLGPVNDKKFENGAIALAGKVGILLNDFTSYKIEKNKDEISSKLLEILRAIIQAAEDADIDLENAIHKNIFKITSRYPLESKDERVYSNLFDESFDVDEQIPRRLEIVIEEKDINDRLFVIQKCQGIKIGDRLTDNKIVSDDYRFHDVFHLAYAAILGWSPVIRSLFKVKRKSSPQIDEDQDGARAILIEEGVATWIFNHGIRLNNYESIKSLDFELLKAVKELVKGYEVYDCPFWQWEEAILAGFKVFRYLKTHRKGLVIADLNKRKITVGPIIHN